MLALRAPRCRAADIEVVRHYDEKLPRVQSDPLLLHQVFLNIVMNAEHAIAATGHGGRIEITTAVTRARATGSSRRSATPGTGFRRTSLSRIFEPFYTTKEVGKGTGLGPGDHLRHRAGARRARSVAGAIHPDGGAVFTVELPVDDRVGTCRCAAR